MLSTAVDTVPAAPPDPAIAPEASSPFSFRVLTVNIHKGFSGMNRHFVLPELREAVRRVGAEVVLLQEVHGRHERHAERVARWPSASQVEFLADSLWSQHAYGRNAIYPHGDHGNAVLSMFPIVAWRNHDVSHGTLEQRGLLHCRLRVPGAPAGVPDLDVVCVHLGLREDDRRRQLHRLCALVESEVPHHAPLIVAGDFNDWRGSAQASLARVGLREVHAGGNGRGRPPRTFPARWPLLRLDRIYVRGVRRYTPLQLPRRPWAHLSDHAPLGALIEP